MSLRLIVIVGIIAVVAVGSALYVVGHNSNVPLSAEAGFIGPKRAKARSPEVPEHSVLAKTAHAETVAELLAQVRKCLTQDFV